MHQTTALFLLQNLARLDLVRVDHTSFLVPPYPAPVHLTDVRASFEVLREVMGFPRSALLIAGHGGGIVAWTSDRLFEKLFRIIFVRQKLYPKKGGSDNYEGGPLPNIFVGAEKTQVRQIPLTDRPPWPFKFLLELGGMVVVRPQNKRDMLLELRQFLNNHPQYLVRVDAKEWPDGSVAIFTWWFERLPRGRRKSNVNVPTR